MITPVKKCRICGNTDLEEILSLGDQVLTGVFPSSPEQKVTSGPLTLLRCKVSGPDQCGLVQLGHSYNLEELYGDNYGYRSGLNKSMVTHLFEKVRKILSIAKLERGDLIIDIGSNDSTTLQAYPPKDYLLLGVDPTGVKFKEFYPPHIQLLPDFFSAEKVRGFLGYKKAKVITSFSMFYDLEEPLTFMKEVAELLDQDGVWVFEQSYLPMMLETNSYDTICHEHLEYYAFSQVHWMTERAGLKVIDFELNDINGGSFSVAVAKKGSSYPEFAGVREILQKERELGIFGPELYNAFYARVKKTREDLLAFLEKARKEGKTVYGLGASTKGNVLLQYCRISGKDLPAVGEVNRDKWGRFTPGTHLPIVAEDEILAKKPDYLMVLPWHFRRFFEKNIKFQNTKLVFPLPKLDIVN